MSMRVFLYIQEWINVESWTIQITANIARYSKLDENSKQRTLYFFETQWKMIIWCERFVNIRLWKWKLPFGLGKMIWYNTVEFHRSKRQIFTANPICKPPPIRNVFYFVYVIINSWKALYFVILVKILKIFKWLIHWFAFTWTKNRRCDKHFNWRQISFQIKVELVGFIEICVKIILIL